MTADSEAWLKMENLATKMTQERLLKESKTRKQAEEKVAKMLSEIKENLDAEADTLGLSPEAYRLQLETSALPTIRRPVKLRGRTGSTLREWSIIHQIIQD